MAAARRGALPPGAPTLRIALAGKADLPFVRLLLSESGLPVEGVERHFSGFLVARLGGDPVGCVGMERYGEHVLVRSLAVARRFRRRGIGAALLRSALERARAQGGRTAWGLTTFRRKRLFTAFGFRTVPRNQAPPALGASSQFRGICPDSATLITLPLERA